MPHFLIKSPLRLQFFHTTVDFFDATISFATPPTFAYDIIKLLFCERANSGSGGGDFSSRLSTSFVTLFWTLFGVISLTVLEVNLRYIEGFGKVLFGLYNVAARILFLNMLIAMMSKSFNVTVVSRVCVNIVCRIDRVVSGAHCLVRNMCDCSIVCMLEVV